jgi:hypothetical protein
MWPKVSLATCQHGDLPRYLLYISPLQNAVRFIRIITIKICRLALHLLVLVRVVIAAVVPFLILPFCRLS